MLPDNENAKYKITGHYSSKGLWKSLSFILSLVAYLNGGREKWSVCPRTRYKLAKLQRLKSKSFRVLLHLLSTCTIMVTSLDNMLSASGGGEGKRRHCSCHGGTDSSGPSNGMGNLHSWSNSIPIAILWSRCYYSYFTEKKQMTQKSNVPRRKQLLMVVPGFQPRSVWCKDSALNCAWSPRVIVPSCSMELFVLDKLWVWPPPVTTGLHAGWPAGCLRLS